MTSHFCHVGSAQQNTSECHKHNFLFVDCSNSAQMFARTSLHSHNSLNRPQLHSGRSHNHFKMILVIQQYRRCFHSQGPHKHPPCCVVLLASFSLILKPAPTCKQTYLNPSLSNILSSSLFKSDMLVPGSSSAQKSACRHAKALGHHPVLVSFKSLIKTAAHLVLKLNLEHDLCVSQAQHSPGV